MTAAAEAYDEEHVVIDMTSRRQTDQPMREQGEASPHQDDYSNGRRRRRFSSFGQRHAAPTTAPEHHFAAPDHLVGGAAFYNPLHEHELQFHHPHLHAQVPFHQIPHFSHPMMAPPHYPPPPHLPIAAFQHPPSVFHDPRASPPAAGRPPRQHDGLYHNHVDNYHRWIQDKATEFLQNQSTEELHKLQTRLIVQPRLVADGAQEPQQRQQADNKAARSAQHKVADSRSKNKKSPNTSPTMRPRSKPTPVSDVRPPLPALAKEAPVPAPPGVALSRGPQPIAQNDQTQEDESQHYENVRKHEATGHAYNNANKRNSAEETDTQEGASFNAAERRKARNFNSHTTLCRTKDDTPGTLLARQLIGHDPITEDSPSIAIDPDLVQNISSKIRVALNEMVEAAIGQARDEIDQDTVKQVTRELERARNLVNDRVVEFQQCEATRNQLIEKLHTDTEILRALGVELDQQQQQQWHSADDNYNGEGFGNRSDTPNHKRQKLRKETKSATVANLWKQLEGGLAKIQSQDREVAMLREDIDVNAVDKKRKDALVAELGALLDHLQRSNSNNTHHDSKNDANPNGASTAITHIPSRPPSPPNNTHLIQQAQQEREEIIRLGQQKKELENTLNQEKHFSELSIQSYMEASIYHLKQRRKREEAAAEAGDN